jgi:PKHD-type hydroxylase
MFLEIPNLLTAQEVAELRGIAEKATFVDGKVSNPHNPTKNNLQVDQRDDAYARSSKIGLAALVRSEEFRNFAFPRLIAPPLLARYEPGMRYGAHTDVAVMNVQGSPLRSDLSCTIFLEDPSLYEGGELVSYLGSKPVSSKGVPGAAIVYPSTTLHEVRPVTKGRRLVMITFIQSQMRDQQQREILYTLGEVSALEGLRMEFSNRTLLESARWNLMRMWMD